MEVDTGIPVSPLKQTSRQKHSPCRFHDWREWHKRIHSQDLPDIRTHGWFCPLTCERQLSTHPPLWCSQPRPCQFSSKTWLQLLAAAAAVDSHGRSICDSSKGSQRNPPRFKKGALPRCGFASKGKPKAPVSHNPSPKCTLHASPRI